LIDIDTLLSADHRRHHRRLRLR